MSSPSALGEFTQRTIEYVLTALLGVKRIAIRVETISSCPSPSKRDANVSLQRSTLPTTRIIPKPVCIGMFAISLLFYSQSLQFNSFRNGFHMDDVVAIQKNLDVVNPGYTDWVTFLRHDFWGLDMFSGEWTHKSFRPITTLSYRWNWLMSGLDTGAYHISNVVMHSAVCALLVLTCSQVMRMSTSTSFLTGALFAVHPVHTESVLYLVGRADILCAIFMLAAIIVYHRSGSPRAAACAYSLVILAGLAKELGFMTFPVLIVMDWIKSAKNGPRRSLCTAAACVICMYVRHWYTDGTYLKMSPQDNPISFEEDSLKRRLSYMVVHGEYARLLVYPLFLCYDYSLNTIPIVASLADMRLLSPAATYLAFTHLIWHIAVAVRCSTTNKSTRYSTTATARESRTQSIIIATALFVFSFLPMSNIAFPVGTVVGERLMYIPSIGFVIALVQLWPRHRLIWLVGVWSLWAVRTVYRVDDWKTASNLTLVDGYRNIRSAKTQYNLGVQYFTKQKYNEAYSAFVRSFESDELRRDGIAYWRAGQAELLRGNLVNAENLLTAATTKYGAKLMVREEEIFHDAGLACFHNGHVEEARYYLTSALTLNRRFPKALNNMGCFLVSQGDAEAGLRLLIEASEIKGKNVIYSGNVWIVASSMGRDDTAQWAKNVTLTVQPSFEPNKHCVWEFKPAEGGPGDTADKDDP